MYIIRHVQEVPSALSGVVLAIGNFDGLHLGHQALLAHAKDVARTSSKPLAVMTFEPHPRHFFRPDLPPGNLFSFREKIENLSALGVEYVHAVPFGRSFSDLSAQQFIERILMQAHRVSHVVTGSDFVFGHDRGGNSALLQTYAGQGAFGYTAFTPLAGKDENKISSTRIRTLLADGNPDEAAQLLGRPYAISGRVIHGDKRGRAFGFPTLNMTLKNRFVPKFGIYAVTVKECDSAFHGASSRRAPETIHTQGQQTDTALSAFHGASSRRAPETIYKGVANLGIRPMYRLDMPLLETHLFDMTGDWYGKRLSVELRHYIREEMRFDSEAKLKEQMQADGEHARSLLV